MMIGERHRPSLIVPWSSANNTISDVFPPSPLSSRSLNAAIATDYGPYNLQEAVAALQRYLPANEPDLDSDSEFPASESDSLADNFACDNFRMYEFKVRRCPRGRSHDWTECPYAHPGEKARRRDPRRFHYSGAACPDFRKGSCRRGDGCEFAHGVFECWLHPARYRTQPCKDGTSCRRRVCFFAHTAEQLRVLPQQSPLSLASIDSFDGSPLRQVNCLPFLSSPGSMSPPETPPADSPPISPITQSLSRSLGSGSGSVNEMIASLRNLQLNNVNSLPTSRNPHINGSGLGSPVGSMLRPGFSSPPPTPTASTCSLFGWDNIQEEEPAMERVESGRGLRAKMFEKLSKENSLGRADPDPDARFSSNHDIDWVSELLK